MSYKSIKRDDNMKRIILVVLRCIFKLPYWWFYKLKQYQKKIKTNKIKILIIQIALLVIFLLSAIIFLIREAFTIFVFICVS